MNPHEWLEMARDPRFIPGIYNYCDRWCERCAFTDRCLNYATSVQRGRPFDQNFDEDAELDTEALAEELTEVFQDTIELIRAVAEEEGIELDTEAPEVEAEMARDREAMEHAEEHPLTEAANRYIALVHDWFAMGPRRYRRDRDMLVEAALPAGADPASVLDALEVIRWYQFMISVKIQRALSSREREADDPEFWEEMPKDSDGTAKVALIALDRSIGAWGALLPAFPQRQAATLEILALLSRLRSDLEQEFPNAWAFVRPGFDEVGDR
ncbi:MAG: hypothetical protein NZ528_15575 [Caldilineales bacterium]|nr:hypothetical protein [Caldilineales bacterium]MDW8316363.1 hypothetical protein [Anaerolineae bacterium]